LYLVVGVVERGGSTLYCSALYVSPEGSLLGKRRKLMPTGAERLVWGFGDGSTMNVYDTGTGRLGAVLCWENLMPAARMAMYEQGINSIVLQRPRTLTSCCDTPKFCQSSQACLVDLSCTSTTAPCQQRLLPLPLPTSLPPLAASG
jgi:hypothetical protein